MSYLRLFACCVIVFCVTSGPLASGGLEAADQRPQPLNSVVLKQYQTDKAIPVGSSGGLKMFYDNRMYPQAVAVRDRAGFTL